MVNTASPNSTDMTHTWTHTIPDTTTLLVQCPICCTCHSLIDPPTGTVTISVDCTPQGCSMLVDGIPATNLEYRGPTNNLEYRG